MMSAQKNQPTWAEIVKGKTASTESVEQKFHFNADVQEFQINSEVQKFEFNPEVQEFKPQINKHLNPSAKDFDPQLIAKAAQMTNLLLEYYSDSDDDDDDDKPHRGLQAVTAPVAASKALTCAQLNPLAKTFSPPVNKSLNPSAKDFDPKLMQKAEQMANVLRECYSDSDDDDHDDATPVTSAKALAHARLNPLATVFSPPAKDVMSSQVAAFRPPPGLTLPDVVQMNVDCYSSDDESLPRVSNAARRRVAKLAGESDEDSDSTSAGKTSDSDTESLYM